MGLHTNEMFPRNALQNTGVEYVWATEVMMHTNETDDL